EPGPRGLDGRSTPGRVRPVAGNCRNPRGDICTESPSPPRAQPPLRPLASSSPRWCAGPGGPRTSRRASGSLEGEAGVLGLVEGRGRGLGRALNRKVLGDGKCRSRDPQTAISGGSFNGQFSSVTQAL